MAIQQQDPAADDLEELQRPDAYAQWQKREGVRVIEDFLFDDLNAIELGSWPRKGGKGAIINIPNPALPNDAHLVEIGPGGHSEPESHLYEEMVYILRGHGAASVWFDEQHKQTFEWGEGSLFAIPLNTSYQLFNGSGSDSARYISVTNLPPMIRLFQNAEFVFNNPFRFRDRFSGEHGYFSGEGKLYRGRKWQSNFIPDAAGMKLYGWKERGAGGVNAMLELPQNNLAAHISEFPVGTYKKAHRHGPGAHLVILSGDGFSMVWREGEERRKLDWRKGGMVIVPWEDTFHQHFNAGAEPARYLALRGGGGINRGGNRPGADLSIKLGGWQVEYEDEDPEIHRIFEAELERHDATCRMKAFVSSCTGEYGPTSISQRD